MRVIVALVIFLFGIGVGWVLPRQPSRPLGLTGPYPEDSDGRGRIYPDPCEGWTRDERTRDRWESPFGERLRPE